MLVEQVTSNCPAALLRPNVFRTISGNDAVEYGPTLSIVVIGAPPATWNVTVMAAVGEYGLAMKTSVRHCVPPAPGKRPMIGRTTVVSPVRIALATVGIRDTKSAVSKTIRRMESPCCR